MGIGNINFSGRVTRVLMGICALLAVGAMSFLVQNQPSASATFDGLPTETPRRDLPTILDGTVFDSTQVGDFIVVAGDFTEVRTEDGRILQASGVYAYHIDTGAMIETFLPALARTNGNAPAVNAVVGAGGDSVFIGGQFNSVNGAIHHRLAKVSIVTGRVDNSFTADFNSQVTQLDYARNRLFVGGDFTTVNGTSRQRLAEVNPSTGAVVASFQFDITQSSRPANFTYGPRFIGVTNDDILVVVHRGEMVDGFARPGIALIDLKSNNLLGYSTNFWAGGEIFAYDADVAPDGSYIVVVSNGGDFPLEGKDTGIRFDISDRHTSNQSERWVARNFDSTYAVAISNSAVYMGGHFCNVEGPGSPVPFPGIGEYTNNNSCFGITPASRFPTTVNRDQLAAFDPLTGTALNWDPGTDGLVGVQSLEVIDRGLLIGHDGEFIGRDGTDRRAWRVGRHGFLDNNHPNGLPPAIGGPLYICNNLPATIVGTAGNDVINGTPGNDVIVGLEGKDTINGLGGDDVICGGEQTDTINGGAGDDIIFGNKGRDKLSGGTGKDLLAGGVGSDTVAGGKGDDDLRGGTGNDEILGGKGTDTLDGGAGNDELFGKKGQDRLEGNTGNDFVNGGNGTDRCVGGVFGNADSPGDSRTNCESR